MRGFYIRGEENSKNTARSRTKPTLKHSLHSSIRLHDQLMSVSFFFHYSVKVARCLWSFSAQRVKSVMTWANLNFSAVKAHRFWCHRHHDRQYHSHQSLSVRLFNTNWAGFASYELRSQWPIVPSMVRESSCSVTIIMKPVSLTLFFQ